MDNTLRPFHLAIPVDDLDVCRKFYGEILELPEGRSSDHWVDFDFFGHQLVIHLKEAHSPFRNSYGYGKFQGIF